MDIKLRVEAILYATRDPLSISDISSILSEDREIVAKTIRRLMKEYGKRETALRIAKSGIRYSIQLKEEFIPDVSPVMERELTNDELKTLGFVAANPNCKKGDLKLNVGLRTDEVIETLKRKRLIFGRRYRNTEIYNVTKKFFSYFSLDKKRLQAIIGEKQDRGDVID